MKKIIFLFIIIIIISSLFILKNTNPKDELSTLGYNNIEIELINKLNKNNKNYVLNHKYIKNINKLLNNKDFKEKNLKQYLYLIDKNISIENSIYIVNNNFFDKNIDYDETTISLMKAKYYIHKNLERYLTYKKENNLDINSTITNVNSNLDYDFYSNDQSVDFSKKDLILVNKFYKLDSNYVPDNLVNIDSIYGQGQIKENVYTAFKEMYDAAKVENLHLKIISPYRSYSTQNRLYNNYASRDGKKNADTYSARPGYSEHQTGLAMDIVTPTTSLDTFENTDEFKWLYDNAYKYGFILRYPKGKEYITGYIYESWHYRYVGKKVAKQIKDLDITYEEYYAYFVK